MDVTHYNGGALHDGETSHAAWRDFNAKPQAANRSLSGTALGIQLALHRLGDEAKRLRGDAADVDQFLVRIAHVVLQAVAILAADTQVLPARVRQLPIVD